MKKNFTRDLQKKLLVVDEANFIELLDGVALDKFSLKGNSPLHFAARRGFRLALKNLIREGADPTKLNNEGKSIAHIALENGHVSLALEIRSITRAAGHQSLSENVRRSLEKDHSTERKIGIAAGPEVIHREGYLSEDYLFSPEEDPKDYFDRTHKASASGVFTPVSNVVFGEESDFNLDVEELASENERPNDEKINSFNLEIFENDTRKIEKELRKNSQNLGSENGKDIQRRISISALENSPATAKARRSIQEIPDMHQGNLLDFLDSSPALDASKLAIDLNNQDHFYFTLFEAEEANEALAQARTISPEAAAEFKAMCFLVGEKADTAAILVRIEEMFGFSEKTRQRREADQLEAVRLEASKEESKQRELIRIEEEEREVVPLKKARVKLAHRDKEHLEKKRHELVIRVEPFVQLDDDHSGIIKKDHQDVNLYQERAQTNLPKEGRSRVFESLLFSLIFFLVLVFFSY